MRAYIIAVLAAASATAASAASAAHAQGSPSAQPTSAAASGRGFSAGVSAILAPGITIKGEDIEGEVETEMGGGAGVQLAYGFARGITAFATFDIARQGSAVEGVDGSFGLVTFELGARYALPMATGRVSPYVLAALGGRALGARIETAAGETDAAFTGGMLDVGGGVQLPIAPKLMLDGEVRVGFGKFDKYEEDGEKMDIDTDNTVSPRVRVGLSWYPGGR